MRRFVGFDREEDFSQIQFLTAECVRLSQEKVVLQRELLVSHERLQLLQAETDTLSSRWRQQEQLYLQLSIKHEQQKKQADVLQQRVLSVTEDRWRDVSLLRLQLEQVSCDLQQLQGSEAQLMGLVDQLQAQHAEVLETKTLLIEHLETQLKSKSLELKELQISHDALQQGFCDQHSTHQKMVEDLRRENTESLRKLRETAEQFEWLCEQQRSWMNCVKRFKQCLSGEKESLELQVSKLQTELDAVRTTVESSSVCEASSSAVGTSKLQAEVKRWKQLYENLLEITTEQGGWTTDGHLKPP